MPDRQLPPQLHNCREKPYHSIRKLNCYLLVLMFCFVLEHNYAQTRIIDSLKLVLKNAKHDTTRCRTLYKLGGWLEINNMDTALIVFKQMEDIAKANLAQKISQPMRLNYNRFVVKALNTQGYLYMYKSDSKGMYRSFSESVKLSEAIKDKGLMATSYVNMGM